LATEWDTFRVAKTSPEQVLRTIRLQSGIRQAELALKLGRPQSFISKYETLERRLTFEEVEMVSSLLGVPMYEFLKLLEQQRSGK
jgi:transcriptional regulator with XRE-family HTH domain